MEHHVGIDVSLELSSVCVLDATGMSVPEASWSSRKHGAAWGLYRGARSSTDVGLAANHGARPCPPPGFAWFLARCPSSRSFPHRIT